MSKSFEGIEPSAVMNVTCIGAGPIGAGWSAYFLAQGFDVTSYIHAADEEASLRGLIDDAWGGLSELGLADGASRSRLAVTSDLGLATRNAEFIQESAPESLPLKQALYQELGDIVAPKVTPGTEVFVTPPTVRIASGISGLGSNKS